MSDKTPLAVVAEEVPPRRQPSVYPAPFAALMQGREKRALGDFFGLTNFGVNLTSLAPGASSALRHGHAVQDEFIYVLVGPVVLISDAGETVLESGMCAGMRAGSGDAFKLLNRSQHEIQFLEVGDRLPGDSAFYPDDDLQAALEAGKWVFRHKDGRPW